MEHGSQTSGFVAGPFGHNIYIYIIICIYSCRIPKRPPIQRIHVYPCLFYHETPSAAAESLHVPFTLVSCGNAGCCSGTPLGSGTEPLPQPYKHSPSMTSVSPSKQPQLTFGNAGYLWGTQPTIWNPMNVKFPIEQRSEQNTALGKSVSVLTWKVLWLLMKRNNLNNIRYNMTQLVSSSLTEFHGFRNKKKKLNLDWQS